MKKYIKPDKIIKTAKQLITQLKTEANQFLEDSFSEKVLKKTLDLTSDEIFRIKPTIKFSHKRYLKEDIIYFLKNQNKKLQIFMALDSGQTSFFSPTDKKGQNKLAIKLK